MDKNAIKKFAVWARRELIEKVSQKALQYGIEASTEFDSNIDSINGVLLSDVEKKQRQALITKINEDGYDQVMEEVAYTWFNRFIALRFMEVNGYLPSHVRVFTDENNNFKPQILTEALHLDFENLDKEKVMEMKQNSQDDDLYKYLLLTQCNALNAILPRMFPKIADYTELLLPDYLLREGSVIEQMVTLISENDWTDQVQIIGWLYQDYNSELKDEVFERASSGKISKEEVPAATQLFTPDWIVRFLVDNSLERAYINGHDDYEKPSYYLAEDDRNQKQISNYAGIDPKLLKCIDPCCGSGHMLCYVFDALVKEYLAYGYTQREAVRSIIENNIVGLDIDNRAAQLSYFSIMMKAAQYDRRFLRSKDSNGDSDVVQPRIYSVISTDSIDDAMLKEFAGTDEKLLSEIRNMIYALRDAKEYGSLIRMPALDYTLIEQRLHELSSESTLISLYAHDVIAPVVKIAEAISDTYDIVVTNPPYMGSSNMDEKLIEFVKKEYPDGKNDLFSCFILRCMDYAKKDGYVSMITQSAWMFQSRFESLRKKMSTYRLLCMAHLGTRAFDSISGEVVQTTAFCYQKNSISAKDYITRFVKLTDFKGEDAKEKAFFEPSNYITKSVGQFDVIPGTPMAYYISDKAINVFEKGDPLKHRLVPKQGTSTGDDKTFVRSWYEIDYSQFKTDCDSTESAHASNKIYFPLDKGGEYRKWYGNNEKVIRFDRNSYSKLLEMGNHLPSRQYYFKGGLTWSKIASELSVRFDDDGFVFSSVGLKGFPSEEYKYYILGFMNSSVCRYFIKVLSPGMSIVSGDIEKLPFLYSADKEIDQLVKENIEITRWDWDNYELSWDFKKSPLIGRGRNIQESIEILQKEYDEKIKKLKDNERLLNEKYANIYGLEDEVITEIEDNTISIIKPSDDICVKSFISYAIGCILGRYSLDEDGVVYAGGEWNPDKYVKYRADEDGIIPLTDDEYLSDDVLVKLVSFIETVYGKDELENCINYMGTVLGGKGLPRDNVREYMLDGFYKDHCKLYQKKPIYWLFDAGKNNGFKCLAYYHRYKKDTASRIRTDYVHELQARYRTADEELSNQQDLTVKQKKLLNKLRNQEDEIGLFEEKIHHIADSMIELELDAGIAENYKIFKEVLAKV